MRTIKEIEADIISKLEAEGLRGSGSKVAEWKLWSFVIASSIYAFELLMELFRKEINAAADKIIPGTMRWYADQCKRFQFGHKLSLDLHTLKLYYEIDDPKSRIINVVAIVERQKQLFIKVAKLSEDGSIIPLSTEELFDFNGYIKNIRFAGISTSVISTTADLIRYKIAIYFSPSTPSATAKENINKAIVNFKKNQRFDSYFYRQKFIESILFVTDVVTAEFVEIEHKGLSMENYEAMGVRTELESGYFDFSKDSEMILISASDEY